jgi:hypothetical protein
MTPPCVPSASSLRARSPMDLAGRVQDRSSVCLKVSPPARSPLEYSPWDRRPPPTKSPRAHIAKSAARTHACRSRGQLQRRAGLNADSASIQCPLPSLGVSSTDIRTPTPTTWLHRTAESKPHSLPGSACRPRHRGPFPLRVGAPCRSMRQDRSCSSPAAIAEPPPRVTWRRDGCNTRQLAQRFSAAGPSAGWRHA